MSKVEQQHVNRMIKGEIYNSLRTALVEPQGKSKTSWTDQFIKIMLDEAKKNPGGPLGQLISRQLLQDDILSSLDEQTEKLLARDLDFLHYRVLKQCFRQQRDIVMDKFISRKLMMTSRRAGKTNTLARLLVDTCIEPNMPCLYIHIKFENAILQCYDLCIDVAKEAEMPIQRESRSEGIIEFSNGSFILFKGNNNKAEAEKFRGGKYKLIAVDEAAFQCNMKYLIEDICTPMLADYKDSQLVLASTPPRVPHTYYEDCLHNDKEWDIYKWTAIDNPFIPDFESFIEETCKKKGLTKDAPFIKREFFGELVYDTEAQVFKDFKVYEKIPMTFVPTDVAIGVDFGYSDYNAFVSIMYNRNSGEGYILPLTRKFNKSTVSSIVEAAREVFEASKKFALERNKDFELNHIYLYCDTNEQSISYEMSTKYGLPITNAYKHDKALARAELSDWLRTGKLKIFNKDDVLIDEMERTIYKRDDQDNIISEIDDSAFHPDALDALLYASRQYAWDCGLDSKPSKEEPTKMSKEEMRASTLPDWMNNEGEY